MTNSSTQYINDIDQNYPLSGRDNNSQGFRDNFKNIKQGLKYIDQDVSLINENSLILSKEINDFQNNVLKRVQFRETGKKIYDETNIIQLNNFNIDYENGHYQKFTIGSGTHKVSLINFPELEKSGNIIISVTTGSNFNSYIDFENNIFSANRIVFPLRLEGQNPHLFKIISDNYEFYLEKLNKDNNFLSPINIVNYSSLNSISEYTTGSTVFLSGNTNSIIYNTGTNWYELEGNKLVFNELTITKNTSIIRAIKNKALTPITPITATSDFVPLTYVVKPNLPSGLILNSQTGEISGTPTVEQIESNYEIIVSNFFENTKTETFSLISIIGVSSTVNSSSISAVKDVQLLPVKPITGSGGYTPLTYSISPSLPSGLTLNPSTGEISGTPRTVQGSTSYTITVRDTINDTTSNSFSLSIKQPLSGYLAQTTFIQYTVNPNTLPIVYFSGGTAPYTVTVTPDIVFGISYILTTGTTPYQVYLTGSSGSELQDRTHTIRITDADGTTISFDFRLKIVYPIQTTLGPDIYYYVTNGNYPSSGWPPPLILTSGTAASFLVTTESGGSNALPEGIFVDPITGFLKGSPSVGPIDIQSEELYTNLRYVIVDELGNQFGETSWSISVNSPLYPTISVQSVSATVNTLFSSTTILKVQGGNGQGGYTYSILPSLPGGLSLSPGGSNGVYISGTPTTTLSPTIYKITAKDNNLLSPSANAYEHTFILEVKA